MALTAKVTAVENEAQRMAACIQKTQRAPRPGSQLLPSPHRTPHRTTQQVRLMDHSSLLSVTDWDREEEETRRRM